MQYISLSAAFLMLLMLPCFVSANKPAIFTVRQEIKPVTYSVRSIDNITLPKGYQRINAGQGSFGAWLRKLPLRVNNTVYLYNRQPKDDQSSHYAVIDISTGNENLQQCADAIMRLRAEYFFAVNKREMIKFPAGNNVQFNFAKYAAGERYLFNNNRITTYKRIMPACDSHDCLMQFLRWVFTYCGTYTVAQQTKPVNSFADIEPGDLLVKAGDPGHAMIVVDVAVERTSGKKIFLLAQGYMPAQDMHIVKNKSVSTLSPWYAVADIKDKIYTPGYVFEKKNLRRWE